MLIPNELILLAKEKYGEQAAEDINNYFKLENWDDKNLRGSCPFGHSDSDPSFIWNHKNSSFHCFSCGKNFGILDLYMLQGNTFLGAVQKLFEKTETKYSFGERGIKTNKNYRYPFRDFSDDRSKVEKYWQERKISKETLDFADIQQDKNGNTVFHYYDLNDVLCLVKYRPSRKIIKKGENKFWAQKDADSLPLLYGMNQVDTTQPLLICEGEGDRLAIIESGFRNVVSIPFGAGNFTWIEHNWDFLEKFKRIIIWGDSDDPGLTMRKECCSRLGIWRCTYVDVPNNQKIGEKNVSTKDANEVLYHFGKEKVLDYIYNAQEFPISGVTDLADIPDFDIEKAPGLFSSIESVNKIIYKYLFGSVVLFTGKRGSGKSSFADQEFISNTLDQGYDAFVFSGELSGGVLKSWVEINLVGSQFIKMKGDFIHIIDSVARKKVRDWYRGRVWVYDNITSKEEEIFEKAIAVTRKYGVKVWILDNLSVMDLNADDSNIYLKQKEFIVKAVNYAMTYDVLIVIAVHPRKLMPQQTKVTADDIAGSGDLSNLVQYILSVHRYTDEEKEGEKDGKGNYKKGKEPINFDVGIDILKNRYTGKLGHANLYFSYPDYRFYLTAEELYRRLKWNTDNSPLPTKLPERSETPYD